MPVIYPTLYIRTALDAGVDVLQNVTAHQRVVIPVRKGTYRNSPVLTPTLCAGGSSTASVIYLGNTSDAGIGGLPVAGHGTPGATWGALRPQLRLVATDEALGIPPRSYMSLESAHALAIGDAVIPGPQSPRTAAVAFTRSGSLCAATAHGLETGDLVTVHSTTTLPAPLTAAAVYSVVKVSADTFRLMDTASSTVQALTSAGTGTHTAVLIESILPPPHVTGVFYFLDAWKPRFSTTRPLL